MVLKLDGESPAKKRKLLHAPEGFERAKRSGLKLQPQKFASAFNHPRESDHSTRSLQPGPSSVRLPPPPVAESSNGATRSVLPPKSVSRPLKHMKPPVFSAERGPSTKFTLLAPSSVKDAALQAAAKPVLKARICDFQPVLPAPPIARPAKALRPLPPPPPFPREPGAPDPSKFKTILTTRMAMMIDITTQSGRDELMALQFAQDVPTYVPPAQRELNRGLVQSPEKASKKKTAKYIRGGLADRGRHIFASRSMALVLWNKDMELQAQRPRTYSRLPPDLCLKILEVVHVTAVASLQRSPNAPRLAVVRCAKIIRGRAIGSLTVLLDFGSSSSGDATAPTLDQVKEDREVHLWRPWKSSDPNAEDLRGFGAKPADGTTLFSTRFRIYDIVLT